MKILLTLVKKVFTDDFSPNLGTKLKLPPTAVREDLIAKDFRRDFVFDYCLKNNIPIAQFEKKNIGEIAESIKGNVKEQIFRTTSKEYKDFIKAMKEFDDPNHHNHGDYHSINLAAQCYLVHKDVFTYEDAAKLPYPGNIRAKLCLDTIEIASKYDIPESMSERVKKKVIFDPTEVDENPLANEFIQEDKVASIDPKKSKLFSNEKIEITEKDKKELDDLMDDLENQM